MRRSPGQRVQDILTALAYLGEQKELTLIGLGHGGRFGRSWPRRFSPGRLPGHRGRSVGQPGS